MGMCRRFKGRPVERLIVAMPSDLVAAIDGLLADQQSHSARGCRSEFVRLAVAEKLGRELMITGKPASRAKGPQPDV